MAGKTVAPVSAMELHNAEEVRDLAAMVKHCTDRAAGCEDEGNRYLEQATRMFKAAGAWEARANRYRERAEQIDGDV